jgi:hypothetical protein
LLIESLHILAGRRFHYLSAAETARPSVFTRPEIAAVKRSWLRDSGRGMDKTGLFVLVSRVNKPDNICSNRLPDAPADLAAVPSRVSQEVSCVPGMPAAVGPGSQQLRANCTRAWHVWWRCRRGFASTA